METDIYNYYEKLAPIYDEDRFGNSYGQYIHNQEKELLEKLNLKGENRKVLDLGCGTGRLLDYATHGVDFSLSMIEQAKTKYPGKTLIVREADHTGFQGNFFDDVISFHVLMHLNEKKTQRILDEAHWVLKKGGRFIFDIPSKKRRKLSRHEQEGWHGGNHFSVEEIRGLTKDKWNVKYINGVLFFPVHRIPVFMRGVFRFLDSLFCRSFFKEYSSYLIFVLEKK